MQKVYISEVSISKLEEVGLDPNDNGFESETNYSLGVDGYLLNCLTRRQQTVAQLLAEGFTRKEVARTLQVSLMAIHRIVPRMRIRLKKKAYEFAKRYERKR